MTTYAQSAWTVGTAKAGGLPLVVRTRTTFPDDVTRALYDHLVVVRWAYAGGKNGMPTAATQKQLEAFDVAVNERFADDNSAILVASLTGNGTKEWRFYVAASAQFLDAVEALGREHGSGAINTAERKDQAWQALAELGTS